MSITLFILYLAVLGILIVTGFVLLGSIRHKGSIARALNMSLFSIMMPRDTSTSSAQSQQRSEKDLISVMEQLYSSFSNLHSKGWNKFLYGEPYIGLEIAVHNTGEEIHFYMAVPRSYEQILEKQVHGFFPNADVQKIDDYNIFHPAGVSLGAYGVLKKESILPFRTYQGLQSDPLTEVVTTLSKLEHQGEGAAIQILMRPSHDSEAKSFAQKVVREMQSGRTLKEALYRARKKPKDDDPNKNQPPRVVTPFEDQLIKGIQTKVSKPLFDVNLRVVTSAADEFRAKQIMQDITGSFVQFSDETANSIQLVPLKGRALQKMFFDFSFRMFNNSYKFLASTEEINSLYHFPMAHNLAPRLKLLKSKPAEPPVNLSSTGIVLGRNVYRGEEREIHMSDEDRRRHLYIIGQTGTGKSTLMKAMLRQDIENGKGVCLVDPHGEFAEFALSIVPPERYEDVIYFDPGDVQYPMGLNMLEIDPRRPEQKSMVIDELFGIFEKLYDLKISGGPMFEKYFKNAALLLLDDYEYEVPTLADISRVLVNDQYRADKLKREKNPLVKEFWQMEAEKAGGDQSLSNIAPYITSKVTSFVFNEFLRPIINQQKSSFNIREVMDNQKILIVNLSKGKIGEINANLLGMVIVGKLLMAALSRVDMDEKDRKDFYLYIDEFQNFTTDSISSILSEARKYRLDLVIAHQFIKQLKDSIRDAVFGNVGSIVSFRIGPDDAEFMKNKFEPVFNPQDLMNIDNLNAYINMLVNGQTTRPFNMWIEKERVFGAGSPQLVEYLKALSRYKYARVRDDVESEIAAKFQRNPGTSKTPPTFAAQ